jgi:hypothetical protein
VETIGRLVHEDRRRTIKDIAAIVNVSYGTVQTILTCYLKMIRRAYGNEAMNRARCFECHARLKRGRTSLEDD